MILIIIQILLFGFLVAADLLSKHFVVRALPNEGDSRVIIDKVLSFTYSKNEGAGFGLFSGKQTFLIVITAVTMAILIGFLIYMQVKKETKKKGGMLFIVSVIMIVAGGVGNLVDRIAFGYVRDFIEYTVIETLFKKSFPICNIADVWCTVGVVLLIIYIIFLFDKTLGGGQTKDKPVAERVEEEASAIGESECSESNENPAQIQKNEEINFESSEESEDSEKSSEDTSNENE